MQSMATASRVDKALGVDRAHRVDMALGAYFRGQCGPLGCIWVVGAGGVRFRGGFHQTHQQHALLFLKTYLFQNNGSMNAEASSATPWNASELGFGLGWFGACSHAFRRTW